ncbi:MAG: DNA gyrase inhibitor YacG [Burkholderiales bacterium]
MATKAPTMVACPRCSALAPFALQNKWRPFCSERCKLIDLGDWAAERYRVPQPSEPSSEDEPPET